MTSPRILRSPLLALLGAGALVVACSDASTGTLSSPYHRGGDNSPTGSGGSTTAGGGGSTTSGNGAAGGSSSGGSSSGGSSSGGSSSGGGTSSSGSSGGDTRDAGPVAPPTPAFAVAVDDATPLLKLADTKVVNVTITPQSWSGAVTLSVASLPADVKATFDNATVTVSGTTPVTAKLTLTSLSSTAPVATPFKVVGTVAAVVQNVPATLTVKPEITINIPVNADSMANGFGTVNITAPQDIANNPVLVNIVNLDSTAHEVHAENKNGFNHGGGTFPQGQADSPVRKVNAAGTYSWHLHDNAPPGGPADSFVVIQ